MPRKEEEEDVQETEDNEEAPEGEDSDESEESDGESSQDESEDKVEQFTDPNKVPPQLKSAFKAMQSSYVRKMQELGGDVRAAEAFRELTQMPEFKVFVGDIESGKGYGFSSAYNNGSNSEAKKSKDDDSEEDDAAPGGKLNMDKVVEALTPVIEKVIAKAVAPLRTAEGERTLKEMRRNNPDFDDYYPDIVKLMKRHPTMGLEEAYELASSKSRKPKVNEEALGKARKARTEGGGASKGGVETLTPKTAKTIKEALQMGLAAATGRE